MAKQAHLNLSIPAKRIKRLRLRSVYALLDDVCAGLSHRVPVLPRERVLSALQRKVNVSVASDSL